MVFYPAVLRVARQAFGPGLGLGGKKYSICHLSICHCLSMSSVPPGWPGWGAGGRGGRARSRPDNGGRAAGPRVSRAVVPG